MNHEWIVEVLDEADTAVTTATVALVPTSLLADKDWPFTAIAVTHKHKASGKYEATPAIVPAAGQWTLIVRLKGKSPVVQPLKMVEKKDAKGAKEFVTSPSPKTCSTVTFSSEIKKTGAVQVRRATFKVKLQPASEVVALSGTEYHDKGTQFRLFAESHRNALRSEKKVNSGVIWTLFSTDDRSRETFVPASDGKWLRVAKKEFGPTKGITPGKVHAPEVGSDVSPPDFYKYISSVGASDPGRILEVGVFSHSYPVGPILFNTSDPDTVATRDPDDFDLRQKDFRPANTKQWPKLAAALAPSGKWHVWGCSATTHHKNLANEAHDQQKLKTPDTQSFVVITELNEDDGSRMQRVEERTTLQRVRAVFDVQFRSNTYMASAAQHLGKPVFGAPPGVGSSFLQVGGQPFMMIQVQQYARLYAYFKAEFGPEFDPTNTKFDVGYVDYARLRKMKAAAPPQFSSAYYYFVTDFRGKTTWILFANKQFMQLVGTSVTLKKRPLQGFATPGKSGDLYELHDTKDKTKSEARFVQEDGSTFLVTRDSSGKFTVLGAKLN